MEGVGWEETHETTCQRNGEGDLVISHQKSEGGPQDGVSEGDIVEQAGRSREGYQTGYDAKELVKHNTRTEPDNNTSTDEGLWERRRIHLKRGRVAWVYLKGG